MSVKRIFGAVLILGLMVIGMGALAQSDPNTYIVASNVNICSCNGATGTLSGNPSGPTGWSAPSPGTCDSGGNCIWGYTGTTTWPVSWTAPAGKCAKKVEAYIRVKPAVPVPVCSGGICPGASGTYAGVYYNVPPLDNCP